jgi:hypothetical protein
MKTDMNSKDEANRKPRFEHLGRKLDEEIGDAAQKLERESERMITYLNDEVVPAIRQGSTRALRTAADQLNRLAEYMDRNRRGK